jgi:hypothetical protein
LTFVVSSATVGWLVGKGVTLTAAQRIVATSFYMLFAVMMSVAFMKTYDELNLVVHDLDFVLSKRDPLARPADNGAMSYWRSKDYRIHAYYAYALNGLFLVLVTALIWRPGRIGRMQRKATS